MRRYLRVAGLQGTLPMGGSCHAVGLCCPLDPSQRAVQPWAARVLNVVALSSLAWSSSVLALLKAGHQHHRPPFAERPNHPDRAGSSSVKKNRRRACCIAAGSLSALFWPIYGPFPGPPGKWPVNGPKKGRQRTCCNAAGSSSVFLTDEEPAQSGWFGRSAKGGLWSAPGSRPLSLSTAQTALPAFQSATHKTLPPHATEMHGDQERCPALSGSAAPELQQGLSPGSACQSLWPVTWLVTWLVTLAAMVLIVWI